MSGLDNNSETTTTTAVTYAMTRNDYNILVLGATGAVGISLLPAALAGAGRVVRVYKDAAAQTITITPLIGLIDGAANTTLATGAAHAKTFVSDGTNYFTLTAY